MIKHNTLRRIATFAMAVVMVLALSVTAFAASGPTITITPGTQDGVGQAGRFEAYQIFTGTVEEDVASEHRQLSHIQWGDGVNSTALVAALQAGIDGSQIGTDFTAAYTQWQSSSQAGQTEQEMVAHFLNDHPEHADAFARIAAQHLESSKTVSTRAGGETGNWTIQVPAPGYYLVKDTIASEESTSGSASSYILDVIYDREIAMKSSLSTVQKQVGDTPADGIIAETGEGSEFKYTLTATLPSNFADYAKYHLTFKDVASKGITVDKESVVVKIDETTIDLTDDYTTDLQPGTEGVENTLTVDIPDLMSAGIKEAVTGLNKDSKIVVTYTGYLNKDAVTGETGNKNDATITYSNDPYDETKTGTSVPDEVKAYTFELNITKVDGSNQSPDTPLAGAEFKLKNDSDQYAVLTQTGDVEPYTYKIESWGDTSSATTVKSGADGKINLAGLATGTYTLEETKAPAGYDAMEDVVFDITASVEGTGELGEVSCELNSKNATREDASFSNAEDGVIDVKLVNYKAAILPHTGGSGTTMLYVAGGVILVAGIALVLFMTKKKNNGSSNA